MKLNINILKKCYWLPNTAFSLIKAYYTYNSNKIEGTSFNEDELLWWIDERRLIGNHSISDFYRTRNSLKAYDYMTKTLGCKIDCDYICQLADIFSEDDKVLQIDNSVEKLLERWNGSNKGLKDVASFHRKFEYARPFIDCNGRIGRLLVIKQCLENNLDIVVIENEMKNEYFDALKNNTLYDFFIKCQQQTDIAFQLRKIDVMIEATIE